MNIFKSGEPIDTAGVGASDAVREMPVVPVAGQNTDVAGAMQ